MSYFNELLKLTGLQLKKADFALSVRQKVVDPLQDVAENFDERVEQKFGESVCSTENHRQNR